MLFNILKGQSITLKGYACFTVLTVEIKIYNLSYLISNGILDRVMSAEVILINQNFRSVVTNPLNAFK